MSDPYGPWPAPPPPVAATTPSLELTQWLRLDFAQVVFSGVSGVYIVSMRHPERLEPIDVGESHDIGDRLARHDRAWLWELRRGLYVYPPELVVEVHKVPWYAMDPEGYRRDIERHVWHTLKGRGHWLCGVCP